MITLDKIGGDYNRAVLELSGESTDKKPIEYINGKHITNNSVFKELDTGIDYKYSEETKKWIPQSKSSGGDTPPLYPIGGARVGEVLIADYTHQGNQEFHFSDFDFETGIGTTTEPHGLTAKTGVLMCPNDWTILSPFKNMLSMPIEWTMVEKLNDILALIPVDDKHLKVVAYTKEEIINVNLEDISNKNVDVTKFHFEKPISYAIKNLDDKIITKYIKVLSSGYCYWTGRYRYRNVSVLFEDGVIDRVDYINTLGFSRNNTSPARNGVFIRQETLVDLRNNTLYYDKVLSYARRKGFNTLVNDASIYINDIWIRTQKKEVNAITGYSTYNNDYAYLSNGSLIQIYALEGVYKNES